MKPAAKARPKDTGRKVGGPTSKRGRVTNAERKRHALDWLDPAQAKARDAVVRAAVRETEAESALNADKWPGGSIPWSAATRAKWARACERASKAVWERRRVVTDYLRCAGGKS